MAVTWMQRPPPARVVELLVFLTVAVPIAIAGWPAVVLQPYHIGYKHEQILSANTPHIVVGELSGSHSLLDLSDLVFTPVTEDWETFETSSETVGLTSRSHTRSQRVDTRVVVVSIVLLQLSTRRDGEAHNGIKCSSAAQTETEEDPDAYHWCCTRAAAACGLCPVEEAEKTSELLMANRSLLPNRLQPMQSRYTITIPHNAGLNADPNARVQNPYIKLQTGRYQLVIGTCNAFERSVRMEGNVIWKSDYGFFPPEMVWLVTMDIGVLVLYGRVFLELRTSIQAKKYQKDYRLVVSNGISVIMGLGLLRSMVRLGLCAFFNKYGAIPISFAIADTGFALLEDVSCRCLMLAICMGWGLVRETLGMAWVQISGLAIFYGGALALHDYQVTTKLASQYDQRLYYTRLGMEAICLIWTFSAWVGTKRYLRSIRQWTAIALYEKLRTVILLYASLAVFIHGCQPLGVSLTANTSRGGGLLEDKQKVAFVWLLRLHVIWAAYLLWPSSQSNGSLFTFSQSGNERREKRKPKIASSQVLALKDTTAKKRD